MPKRLPVPDPRPVLWPLKPVESAHATHERLPDGRLRLAIKHDLVRGCTPAMLAWFFAHIQGSMEYAGATYRRHLVWHPLDHIRWDLVRPSPNGDAGVGARLRIVEIFAKNPDHYVDAVTTVTKLDETGTVDETRFAGIMVMRLEHTWRPEGDGSRFESEMIVGAAGLVGKLVINPWIRSRVFREEMGPTWLRHSIEEIGYLEHFVPGLYRERSAAAST
ncbi:MAG: hypothetical protein M3R70_11505 [Actinomycetota bacterium]|nr:hypothetical protein [Actinomycetota bacterium]